MSGWFGRAKEIAALSAEKDLLSELKTKYKSSQVECGRDAKGQPVFMNTVEFETPPAADDSPRVPVVIAHGFGAGLAFFFRNFDAVAQVRGIRLLAIDWLGMGRSTRCPYPVKRATKVNQKASGDAKAESARKEKAMVRASEDFFLAPLEAWRKSMKIERMVLVGHSLGGYLAAAYALRFPGRLVRLVLVSPVGIPRQPRDWEARFAARAKENWKLRTAKWLWESSTPQQLLRNFNFLGISRWLTSKAISRRFAHLELSEGIKQRISAYLHAITVMARSGEDALDSILKFGAWARAPLYPRMADALAVDTAFIYGEMDWMDPRAARRFLAEKHARVHGVYTVSNGGHHMYLENPREFNPLLIREVEAALRAESEAGKGATRSERCKNDISTVVEAQTKT